MTLIIAGHEFRNGLRWKAKSVDGVPKITDQGALEPCGLFFASDSIITANGMALLGGFRKVYPITVKLWKPYFVGQYFQSYHQEHSTCECVIAFAGGTLTAQHVLNGISGHLEKLRISFERSDGLLGQGRYVVRLACQENELEKGQGVDRWDSDMFLPVDMADLLTADVIADAVEHSINHALESARPYKLGPEEFKTLYTEFLLGVQCPVTKTYRLFEYRFQQRLRPEDSLLEVFTEKEEIPPGTVAVLGRREDFKPGAQALFNSLLSAGIAPAQQMFEYLNQAIDRSLDEGRKDIDRPSTLKVYEHWKLELKGRERKGP